ncbi:MAG TPA: gamma-glutamyl-gamma-aminobutyrate hydrolase family protein [Solirubrobacteraceae bacterium]|jgi:putative glutamine amidotransferase|nr:gamma-glutamyl-gamma-aminobutyrate hydrolase family protein [Solirubrobacteraceae bacterium]
MAPLIGLTTSELREPERVSPLAEGDPAMPELALGLAYPSSVLAAGGVPVILPPVDADADAVLAHLDGLLLTGGPDVHPSAYGQEPDPALGPTHAELDRIEFALARRADELNMPVLAVCRGAQVLNVVRGGTLVQDLPDHRQPSAGTRTTHEVRIAPGSRLHELMAVDRAAVNSFHHQAVLELGRGLTAVAWAPDGIIEGVEATDRDLLVGVQWHAESLGAHPEHMRLFKALVAAAARYRDSIGTLAA